ncbi:stigma-specific STIG1-like protein 1 [Lycium ferocissimum]|uniref:stigma-specific STIG1-like protein 1 n=1 Tax=Lycium ferocissimum TaxID=112874 RepID=UPI002815C0C7|nr:stigma-specific STIG1-like protein 1 [Lycium ferocissimum]
MKSMKVLLILAIIMALSITLTTSFSFNEPHYNNPTFFPRIGNFQPQIPSYDDHKLKFKEIFTHMTCNKNPMICWAKSSPGPFCCKKKCVNVFMDKQNCGFCGNKCKYNENCCKGQCVNTLFNKRHCGGCNNKCQKGSSCAYGMCSYAN